MEKRKPYPTDLNEKPWHILQPLVPPKNPAADHQPTTTATLSTPSCPCFVRAVPGECCPTICPPGGLSSTTFAPGAQTERGHVSMTYGAGSYGRFWVAPGHPLLRAWTPKRSTPPTVGGSKALTGPNRCGEESGISLWIPSGCSSPWWSRPRASKTVPGRRACGAFCATTARAGGVLGPMRPMRGLRG